MYTRWMDVLLVKSRNLNETTWNELQFADDIAILAKSEEQFRHSRELLFEVFCKWGLNISEQETKVMIIGCETNLIPRLHWEQF